MDSGFCVMEIGSFCVIALDGIGTGYEVWEHAEWRNKMDGSAKATGFDSVGEAQDWIEEEAL